MFKRASVRRVLGGASLVVGVFGMQIVLAQGSDSSAFAETSGERIAAPLNVCIAEGGGPCEHDGGDAGAPDSGGTGDATTDALLEGDSGPQADAAPDASGAADAAADVSAAPGADAGPTPEDAGAEAGPSSTPTSDSGGCGCNAAGAESSGGGLLFAGALIALLGSRRSRRRV